MTNDDSMPNITNVELRIADIPSSSPDSFAGWEDISRFALTFNGYTFWDKPERCAEIANKKNPKTLSEFRTCLFFEQRRWRHFGLHPDDEAIVYINSLVECIRQKVAKGEID